MVDFWLVYLLQWHCGGEPVYPGWKLSCCRGRNRSSCRGGCGLQMGVSIETPTSTSGKPSALQNKHTQYDATLIVSIPHICICYSAGKSDQITINLCICTKTFLTQEISSTHNVDLSHTFIFIYVCRCKRAHKKTYLEENTKSVTAVQNKVNLKKISTYSKSFKMSLLLFYQLYFLHLLFILFRIRVLQKESANTNNAVNYCLFQKKENTEKHISNHVRNENPPHARALNVHTSLKNCITKLCKSDATKSKNSCLLKADRYRHLILAI